MQTIAQWIDYRTSVDLIPSNPSLLIVVLAAISLGSLRKGMTGPGLLGTFCLMEIKLIADIL